MASCKLSLALLLAVLATAAASPATARGGVPACGRVRKITVQNQGRSQIRRSPGDLPLFSTNSSGVGGPRHGTHESFPVCSWTGRLSAAGAPPRRRRRRVVRGGLHPAGAHPRRGHPARGPGTRWPAGGHLGADDGAWYEAGFTQLEPVHVEVTPHADPAHCGRLEGHCPTVGCGAGHGRCSRKDEASRDCRNVDELKIIYYKHWNIWRAIKCK
uniref:Thaumatin-like protein n=1 Tax=Setaria viridis TaxID=4556 RepID=A0A4U6VGE2_SETVI|nr:hypothetical protein SEVIR_3G338000v2 [Setaria viridis]